MEETKRIVILHGWGSSTSKLQPLSSELKKLGWETYLPKIPGFDEDPPEKVWDLKDYKDYIIAKTDKHFQKNKYIIFGHSFGGRVAIKAVSSKSVTGIVLCAPGGITRTNPIKRAFFGGLAKTGKLFLAFVPLAHYWRKLLYKAAREHDYERLDGLMKETFKNIISENLKPLLPAIKKPVLILWGEKDKVTPVKGAHILDSMINNQKVVIFQNQSHTLPYEKPNALAHEIDNWIK